MFVSEEFENVQSTTVRHVSQIDRLDGRLTGDARRLTSPRQWRIAFPHLLDDRFSPEGGGLMGGGLGMDSQTWRERREAAPAPEH